MRPFATALFALVLCPWLAAAQTVQVDDQVFAVRPASDLSVPSAIVEPIIQSWPGGVLPVLFPPTASAETKAQFFAACALWSEVAAVQCVERTTEPEYVRLDVAATGCYASVGAGMGAVVGLPVSCWQTATLVHEIGHLFGLTHEHQRADRDSFVIVYPSNAIPDSAYAFAALPTTLLTAYDFLSIMHYSSAAFSRSWSLKTIVPKAPYAIFETVMGMGKFPSFGDAQGMRALYGGAVRPARPRLALLSPLNTNPVSLAWAADPVWGRATYTIIAGTAPGLSNIAVVPLGSLTSLTAVAPRSLFVRVRATYSNGQSFESNEVMIY